MAALAAPVSLGAFPKSTLDNTFSSIQQVLDNLL